MKQARYYIIDNDDIDLFTDHMAAMLADRIIQHIEQKKTASGDTINTDMLQTPRVTYAAWPTDGVCTSKEIAAAWVIGESTFKQKVYMGIYPKQLDVISMRNLWDVQEVTRALEKSNVRRRRITG